MTSQDDIELIDLDVMDRVFHLFRGAYQIAPETACIRVDISSNDERAVYIYTPRDWRRRLHIFVASQRESYIYHEDGDAYAVDKDVTSESLARWLVWVQGEDA